MTVRRTFILALAGVLLAGAHANTHAQPTGKVWKIGILSAAAAPSPTASPVQAALSLELQERGYVEGKNLVVERRGADGKDTRYPALAAELVALKPDLIMSFTGPGTAAAKALTSTIPIIMVGVSDPVGRGYVTSLARPGGNITGIASQNSDLHHKRIELLKTAVPKAVRVVSIGNSGGAEPKRLAAAIESADAAARGVGVTLIRVELGSPVEWKGVTDAIVRDHPDAMVLSSVAINYRMRREIAEFATAQRLPTIGSTRDQAVAGILMSYGPDGGDVIRRAAVYVDRILQGAEPADLPVEQATKFQLVVNLKTARMLGIAIPQSMLVRADEVIQ